MSETREPPMVVKRCSRCKKLFNTQTGKWDESDNSSDSTKRIISSFNQNKFLVEAFGSIKFIDDFCLDCQNTLPWLTVEDFKGHVATSSEIAKKN